MTGNGDPLRVILADDHPGFRRGVAAIVSDADGLELVAEAGDGEEAVEVVLRERPDVVVMDLNMPGLSGIEATRRIAAETPEVGVLVLSMIDDDDSVFAALRAGAHGYLLKEADADEIVHGIVAVHRREAIFGAGIAARVLTYFARPPRAVTPFPELTGRESEILELIAQGLDNREIERRLVVSSKTVRNNTSSIYAKLRVAGRAEAIVRAREAGFGGNSSGQP
jgi:DNA-binding NarL/FixJ family response regulator